MVEKPDFKGNGEPPLGARAQYGWGAFGGLLPFLIRLAQAGGNDFGAALPQFGGLFVLAMLLSAVLGAIASRAFRAHHILAALYHGATATLALAFVTAGEH